MGETLRSEDKKRRRLVWLLVLLPLGALVVFVGLPSAWWVTTSRTSLNRALSDLKAAGIPTSLREIIPPPVADAENAALVYEKAWTELGDLPKDICDVAEELSKVPPTKWPASDKKALSEFLRSKRRAITLIEGAARFDRCRFDVKYEAGLDMRQPHLAHMVSLVKLMRFDVLVKASAGDFDGAVGSALTGMKLSKHCSTDIGLIGKLVEIACHAIAADALSYALRHGEPSSAQLRELLSDLASGAPDTNMAGAIAGDMGLMRDVYDRIRKGHSVGGPRSKGDKDAPPWLLRLMVDRDEAFYVGVMLRYADLADEPYFRVKGDARAIEADIEQAGWACSIARMITPCCDEAIKAAGRQEVQHQVLRLAVALMIYEKEHSVFPDALCALAPDIIPEIPVDPFSGKPYVYRRENGGFVVYSLDRNMKDDGGVSSRDVGKDKGDLVFRYTGKE